MALYLNTQTNEYPRYDGDLILLGWNVGEPLPENWVKVAQLDPPTVENTKVAEPIFPVEINGVWKMQWKIRDSTLSELARINASLPNDGKMYRWNEETLSWDLPE